MRLLTATLLSALLVGCVPPDQPVTDLQHRAVIDGARSPEELGFAIDQLQRNAAVGLLYTGGVQGCTGTLVGDRAVVAAAHCVVNNPDDWMGGAAPVVASPDELTYIVGERVTAPKCVLKPAAVTIHPAARVVAHGRIEHDVSVVILTDSVSATCPQVVPVQINRDAITQDFVGNTLLQGGFGSLDASYNFSRLRYWSLLHVVATAPDYLVVEPEGHGWPSYGDSGSGLLYRFADGSLRTVGVFSEATVALGEYIRLDAQLAYLDAQITPEVRCGAVSSAGSCRDNVVVTCGTRGFDTRDCTEVAQECTVDAQGQAGCACTCDTQPYCQSDCPCDAQCPCACDVSAACDPGCACDPQCFGRDGGLPLDAGGGCACDTTAACDPDCACDPQCADCGVAGGGCTAAATASTWWGWGAFLLVALLLGAGRRARPKVLLLVVALGSPLGLACSSSTTHACVTADASLDATPPEDTSAPVDVTPDARERPDAPWFDARPGKAPGSCTAIADMVNPASCGAGFACDFVDPFTFDVGCRFDGTNPAYADCTDLTPACAAGTTCIGVLPGGDSCRPFCDVTKASAPCPGTGVCAVALAFSVGVVGVCALPSTCDVVAQTGCPAPFACYLSDHGEGVAFCFSAQAGTPGKLCDWGSDCAPGYGCINGKCTGRCKDNSKCASPATCTGFGEVPGHAELGHCE